MSAHHPTPLCEEHGLVKSRVLDSIRSLPKAWHANGSLNMVVIDHLFACADGAENTAETGCGRSTLALSHASRRHVVFACDVPPGVDPETHSFTRVRNSSLLRKENCEFVVGSTQRTLPAYHFNTNFDLVLLDGAHGYPFPELEYFFFYPHLREGGWLVIDDIQIPSVANMVDVLRQDDMFSLDRVVKTTAFFRRTNAPTFPPFGDGWWEQGYNKRHGVALRHLGLASIPRTLAMELRRRFSRPY